MNLFLSKAPTALSLALAFALPLAGPAPVLAEAGLRGSDGAENVGPVDKPPQAGPTGWVPGMTRPDRSRDYSGIPSWMYEDFAPQGLDNAKVNPDNPGDCFGWDEACKQIADARRADPSLRPLGDVIAEIPGNEATYDDSYAAFQGFARHLQGRQREVPLVMGDEAAYQTVMNSIAKDGAGHLQYYWDPEWDPRAQVYRRKGHAMILTRPRSVYRFVVAPPGSGSSHRLRSGTEFDLDDSNIPGERGTAFYDREARSWVLENSLTPFFHPKTQAEPNGTRYVPPGRIGARSWLSPSKIPEVLLQHEDPLVPIQEIERIPEALRIEPERQAHQPSPAPRPDFRSKLGALPGLGFF